MILLKTKLTLGSRKYFLPESPSLQMIVCCTWRFRSYPVMFSRNFVPVVFAIPYHRNIPMDTYICRSYFCSQLILSLQDTLKFPLLIREYFVPTALQFLPHEYPLRIIPRTYRVSALPLLFIWFTRHIEILSDLLINLCPLLLCKYSSACIMVAFHMTSNIH